MKCPFRRVITSEVDHPMRGGEAFVSAGYQTERTITREKSQECYGEECLAFSLTVGCKMFQLKE